MLFEITADGLHHFGWPVAADCPGTAAQAGAIAGLFGVLRQAVKSHVLPARALRRTRRSAIYAGRGNGENKLAVLVRVATEDSLPTAVFAALCHLRCVRHIEYRIGHHDSELKATRPATAIRILRSNCFCFSGYAYLIGQQILRSLSYHVPGSAGARSRYALLRIHDEAGRQPARC